MIRIMRSRKSDLSRKDVNNTLGFSNSSTIDFLKTPEQNLSCIISDIIFGDKLSHFPDVKLIYKLLIKLPKFREFILINEFDTNFIYDILRTGILHSYKLNEIIYTKEKYPKFYFLLLVGSVSYTHDKNLILKPGCFFGDEALSQIRYKHTAKANDEKTVVLLIPKDYAVPNMKEKIVSSNEKVQKTFENSFDIFKTLGNSVMLRYFERMIKIFPLMNEVVASNKDTANAIFIIYNGICLLNKEKKEKLIYVEKGDIVGIESLNNVDENGNLLDNKFVYNIICKSNDAIIFKLYINEFNVKIINAINEELKEYSMKRHQFLNSKEKIKDLIHKNLKKRYRIFQEKENINEYISHYFIKKFTPEIAELSFNNAMKKIKENYKLENDKQKLILKSNYFNRKISKKNYLIKKINESKSYSNLRLSETTKKNIKKNLKDYSLLNLVNKRNSILKTKILERLKQEENKDESNIENTNKKNSDISNVLNNSLENTNNNTFFVTSVKQKDSIYKRIPINRVRNESKLLSSRLRRKNKLKESYNFSEDYQNKIKSFLSSTNNKESYSYRNIRPMSAKQQIETFGCTILDEIKYYNFGDTDKKIKSKNKENTGRKIRNSCLFYETKKFNIPLFIFCEKKDNKMNFPEIN